MKIGLVLAGGGGKGAYELGVWKALKQLNLTKYISVFSGTSIGAFNSVLFAMDEMEKADKLWEEVTMDKLVPVSKTELIKRGIGLYIGGKNLQLAKKFLADKLEHGAISNDGAVEMVEQGVIKSVESNKPSNKYEALFAERKPLNINYLPYSTPNCGIIPTSKSKVEEILNVAV